MQCTQEIFQTQVQSTQEFLQAHAFHASTDDLGDAKSEPTDIASLFLLVGPDGNAMVAVWSRCHRGDDAETTNTPEPGNPGVRRTGVDSANT